MPFFIKFEMEPERIDVNIHPTKTEIKFQDEQMVWQILLAAVREALNRFNAIPTIDFDTENKPDIPLVPTTLARPKPAMLPKTGSKTATNATLLNAYERARSEYEHSVPREMPEVQHTDNDPQFPELDLPQQPQPAPPSGNVLQLGGKYMAVASDATDLTLVDIRRAHLRVLFEQYVSAAENKRSLSQGMLFPQEVVLSAAEEAFLQANLDTLKALGFDLITTDGGTFSLRGIPLGTEGLDPAALLQNIVADALAETDSHTEQKLSHRLALALARRAAMPVGVELSQEEMQHLLTKLKACQTPAYTPNGRPVFRTVTLADIDGMFKS